ncbi:hypothetical protein GCM10007863_26280 [Dyella mobilis]|nr:hypothetical protein GCM10007863_26280 [Dyella mobilis]
MSGAAMDGADAQHSEMDAHKGASRSARAVARTIKVRSIMESALWITGRRGGIDPLDAATPPIGFNQMGFSRSLAGNE